MKKAILAKKIGMTQVFTEDGKMIGVTVLEAGPCTVIQKKTIEKEGYNAVKVGYGEVRIKRLNKPIIGQFNAADVTPMRYIKEFKLEDTDSVNVGDKIEVSVFTAGEKVDISGVSKGKGYQGAIKRHGQHRGPMSHGSKYHRGLGSLSSGTSPGRVKKGKKMPGHMGHKKVTAQNLEVIRVIPEKNLILIRGPVPGARGALLSIKDSVKK